MLAPLLFPLKLLLIAIDVLITLLTFGWIGAVKKLSAKEPLRTVPVADDVAHRVDPRFKGNLVTTPREGKETLYDLIDDAFQRYRDKRCMGKRTFLGWMTPKVKQFGPVQWLSFAEVSAKAHKFGAALKAAGLEPAPYTTDLLKVKRPCRMAIFENTCPEWMIAAIGAISQSITVVTVYATLGMDAVVEAIDDNMVQLVVCNKKDLAKIAEKVPKMPSLRHIVYTEDLIAPGDKVEIPSSIPKRIEVLSMDQFIESGDVNAHPPTPPKPDTCALVMYTSGSTGKPKGVIVTHRQIVAACGAGYIALGVRPGEDVYLAYLPLAHIMEFMAEFALVAMGCTLCYADPKSLSATGAYPIGALEEYSPTIMVAVPKIWDVIKKGITGKVAASSPVVQFLVNTALEWGAFALHNGFETPLFNALVFKKFKQAVGGKLRYAVSGGGPLNAEVQEFIRVALGIDLVQGYGLTETCAGTAIQAVDDLRGGVAGVAIASVELKLVSCPDVRDKAGQPYLSTDRFDVNGNPIFGRGEIVQRGGNVTCGYYMMPDATKEVLQDDGWFCTGDIGQFLSDGSVSIIDRKKNLVKLRGGEYVALEKMEMVFGNSSFVDAVNGGICCYGDGDMDRPVALMQVNEAVAMKWAKEKGMQGSAESILHSKELYDAIMLDMEREHAKSDLSHLENIVAVSLLTGPWTPENGCLTAANKLERRTVVATFQNEFNELKKKAIF